MMKMKLCSTCGLAYLLSWVIAFVLFEMVNPSFVIGRATGSRRPPPSWTEDASSPNETVTRQTEKYIVVAADSTAAYAFYLPMTVRIWNEVAGYGAVVLLVGPEWRSQKVPHTRVVLNALAQTDAIVHIVDVPHGSYTLSTVAQISRLLAALTLPLPDDVFLLVVDVDIWPLDAHHFSPKPRTDFIHIFDAFCCGAKPVAWRGFKSRRDDIDPDASDDWYRVYPAGKGVGMSVGTWRSVMQSVVPASAASAPLWAGRSPGSQLATLTFAVIDDSLAHIRMGKLGSSNRAELEFSGLYTFGQVEWELDQRLLGIAIKQSQRCPRSCYLISHPPASLLDRINWPTAPSSNAAAPGTLAGLLLAHLPMPGPEKDPAGSKAGYGADGWTKVAWLLGQLASSSPPAVAAGTPRNLTAYREAFQQKMVDEVSAVVVSLADPPLAQEAEELAAGLEAQFGRSVLVLLLASGLSHARLQGLALHRNVVLASIPTDVTAGLHSILDLRLHAVREAMMHPQLRGVRVKLFVSPRVRVCAGALQAAVDVASQLPAGRFLPRVGSTCSEEVQGYREDGAAWAQMSAALARGEPVRAGPGPGCVPLEGGGFVLPEERGAEGGGCEGWLDAVTSPFAAKSAVVMVAEVPGGGAEGAGRGSAGWGRVLVKAETTRCAFRRASEEARGLADAVLLVGWEEAEAEGEACAASQRAEGALSLKLRVAGTDHVSADTPHERWATDGEVVVEGIEGEEVYGDAWVAASVCAQVEAALASTRARRPSASKRHRPLLPDAAPDGMVLVSGAGRNYFGCLKNLVGSVQQWAQRRTLLVFDLGLSAPQRREAEEWEGVVVRDLDWEAYPPHVRQLGTYAWKILVWEEALRLAAAERGDASMLWVDACSELRRPMEVLAQRLAANGYFLALGAEETQWNIARDSRLTDPRQTARLRDLRHNLTAPLAAGRRAGGWDGQEFRGVHCLAGLVGLRARSDVSAAFLEWLALCAVDADCIAPVGASLSNHRFEQAALSVVAKLLGMECDAEEAFRAYLRPDGSPSMPLPDDPLLPAAVFVLARRRHPVKPFASIVRRRAQS